MTEAALLDRLRAAWDVPQERTGPPETHAATRTGSKSVADLDAVKAAGVAVVRCGWHVQPFDALEEADRSRPGYVRSSCRLCGAFLGYRSEMKKRKISKPKLGPYTRKPV